MVLRFHEGRGSPQPFRPVAEFDPFRRGAGLAALILMLWPNDPTRRAEAMVTIGLDHLGFCQDDLPGAIADALDASTREQARRLGVTQEAFLAHPELRMIVMEVEAMWLNAGREGAEAAVNEFIQPGGGYRAGARARGWEKVGSDVGMRIAVHGRRAGLVLLTVVGLAAHRPSAHYPRMTASAKRACGALGKTPASDGGTAPAKPAAVFDSWEEWRCISPLYAAMIAELEDGGARPDPDGFEAGVHRVLEDPERLRRVLRWAIWFRGFAVGHKLSNTSKAFLPEEEAIEYRVGLTAEVPPLHDLTGPLLAAARDYVPNE